MNKILIVEDDKAIRSLLNITLSDLGYEIDEAGDGREALDSVEECQPDLIVLDVMMPILSGTGFLKLLPTLKLTKKPRILMLTAKGAEADVAAGYQLGADWYLTKPFELEKVIDTVELLLNIADGELEARRMEEIEKAALLLQVEKAFASESDATTFS